MKKMLKNKMKSNDPLVSIIIPTYNRAHLIGKTLDSIIAQTYSNWECIIVDDGSTDHTLKVLKNYYKEDERFKYHIRPSHYLKGGNDARNYGFEVSKGELINWFDSDDLMRESFIRDKVNCFFVNDVDFVVSRCENFFENGSVKPFSFGENLTKPLNVDNLINRKVFWVTGDFMIKKGKIDTIKFDPEIRSSQEYNFFVKLLAHNKPKGFFLNKILYNRRVHIQSIQGALKTKTKNWNKQACYYNIYLSVNKLVNKESRNILLDTVMATTFNNYVFCKKSENTSRILKYVFKEKGFLNTIIYVFSLFSAITLGKGYKLMLLSRK